MTPQSPLTPGAWKSPCLPTRGLGGWEPEWRRHQGQVIPFLIQSLLRGMAGYF